MGKKTSSSKEKKRQAGEKVKITSRFKANLTMFQSKSYCHLNDLQQKKCISLNMESLKKLRKVLPSIMEKMKLMEKEESSESSVFSSDSDSE